MKESDKPFYDQIARELKENELDQGTWLKALTESKDDTKKAETLYVEYRISELKGENTYHSAQKLKGLFFTIELNLILWGATGVLLLIGSELDQSYLKFSVLAGFILALMLQHWGFHNLKKKK